ncbi:MAG: ankyrin repeat domain-containing protein [Gemmatimonadota bacterium]
MRRLPLLLTALALMVAAPRLAVAQDAQSQLWDGSMSGDTAAISQALGAGAKIDSLDTRRNQNGRRALNWAAWYNRAAAVRLLIEKGATIEAENRTGFAPLTHAAEAGSLDAARILLANGANPTHANGEGLTPAAVARAHGHLDVAELIEAAERGVRPVKE